MAPQSRRLRLYEIGRHGAVDLSQKQDHEEIHSPWVDNRESLPSIMQAVCVILACFIPYFFLCNRIGKSPWKPWKWIPYARIIFPILFVVGIGLVISVSMGSERDGEPMVLFSGVSIWGTEAIRLLAILCSIAFIAYASVRLKKNADDISREFDLTATPPAPVPLVPKTPRGILSQPWRAWTEVVKWNCSTTRTVIAVSLWNEYRVHGGWKRRLIRVALYVVAAAVCVLLLSHAFMHPQDSIVPARPDFICR